MSLPTTASPFPVEDQPAAGSRTRPILVAVLTVLGWHALAMAILWTVAYLAADRSRASDPDGFTGLIIVVFAIVGSVAITLGAVIGTVVTAVRASRKPHWLPPSTSNGKAMLAGTRTAAWGLLAFVPVLLLFIHP